jgi:hypothetical protein
MHLCDYMEALRREAPLEWRHKFLAYQRLKQSLEDLRLTGKSLAPLRWQDTLFSLSYLSYAIYACAV